MKKWYIIRSFALGLLLISTASITFAETDVLRLIDSPKVSGWAGYVQLLAGSYSGDGLGDPIEGNEKITSLDGQRNRVDTDFLVPLWQLRYHFADQGITLFAGTPENGINENEVSIEIGASQALADGSELWASYVPGLPEYRSEVWKDPYLTGTSRKLTESSLESVHLGIKYLFGSPLSFQYDSGKLTIKDEQAGKSRLISLSNVEIDQLRRAADIQRLRVSLTLPLTDKFYVIPEASFTSADAEGESNNYSASSLNLTVAYLHRQLELFAMGNFSNTRYDNINPIFNLKREDDNFGVTVGASYLEPFGWENIKLDFITGGYEQDSNTHFFDSSREFLALGLTWEY